MQFGLAIDPYRVKAIEEWLAIDPNRVKSIEAFPFPYNKKAL